MTFPRYLGGLFRPSSGIGTGINSAVGTGLGGDTAGAIVPDPSDVDNAVWGVDNAVWGVDNANWGS